MSHETHLSQLPTLLVRGGVAMSNDLRITPDDTPITGISDRIDQLVNERFRTLALAVLKLQTATIIEPVGTPPPRPYDGMIVFADGVTWSPDGSGQPGMFFYYDGEWHRIADDTPDAGYMRWHNTWTSGNSYQPNDVVFDDGWLMCCNTPTTERPAPVSTGPLDMDLPDVPAWAESQFLGVVWSGTEYTVNEPGWIQRLSVWVPELTEDTNYRIILATITDPDNPIITTIEEPVLIENDWTTIAIGQTPASAGSKFMVILDALNSGGSTVVIGGWTRGTDSNNNEPAAGQWNRVTQNTTIRIHFTDLDSQGRQTELESIIPGSTIQFSASDDANRSVSYHVDTVATGATSVVYGVTQSNQGIGGDPQVGEVCSMTATIPIAQTTKYVQMLGHWPANQPSFATTRGLLRLGGVDQPADNDAFGVRVHFQPASVSEHWDFMAYSDLSTRTATNAALIDEIKDMANV